MRPADFSEYIMAYPLQGGGQAQRAWVESRSGRIPQFIGEFWTSRQRQASSIHEISYRACFKPQLPRFFIEALTSPGDLVYDPFSGRGTTVIEAGLLGRRVAANDINPLSALLARPRFFVPSLTDVQARIESLPLAGDGQAEIDLSMFYHRRTEGEIVALRKYLLARESRGEEDEVDRWIRMVATNRLSGHSSGFFSVYTLPPNQAVTPQRQLRINKERSQIPPYREVGARIMRKSVSLVRDLDQETISRLARAGATALFLGRDARNTPEIADSVVGLTVTSPPFLNVVQYARDNWLRCWFNGIDPEAAGQDITMAPTLEEWGQVMAKVFAELFRVTAPGGWVAFEVGEIKKGAVHLDEQVLPLGTEAGFQCAGIVVNTQEFTKTANIWGIRNNALGTNTNRIVLFYKKE